MKYDFDQVVDRRGTSSLKWDCVGSLYGSSDVLPMWVADMDFAAPEPVVRALLSRARQGVYGYTVRPASLGQAIADWMGRRHGWQIDKKWISYNNGVVPALALTINAFSQPGDKVIIQSPVYHPFFSIVRNNGRQLVNNELMMRDGRYIMDFEALEKSFDPRVKMLILCSPHNPVGRVWSRDELARLGEICLSNGVLIVSDEIHCDLLIKGAKHVPLASISPELAQNSITCIAPSKTFNLAGLATAAVIIPNPQLRGVFNNALENAGQGMSNVFGLTAWEVACRDGEEWLEQLLDYLAGNLEFLLGFVEKRIPRIRVVAPEGTYLVWLDCRDLGLDPARLNGFMAREAKVGLNDGAMFGPGGAGFQRMNIACPRSILAEGLKRIEQAVNRL